MAETKRLVHHVNYWINCCLSDFDANGIKESMDVHHIQGVVVFHVFGQECVDLETRYCSFFGKNPRETCLSNMWPSSVLSRTRHKLVYESVV